MHKPAIKLLLVLLPPLLVIIWLETKLPQVPNSYKGKMEVFQKNANETQTLILGSSQALYGMVPELISPKAINLANLNQDLTYDHQLLFQYIDSFPHLKTVYATLTYFTLGYELINTKESWRSYFYERIWNLKPTMHEKDFKSYSWLALYGPRNALNFARHNFKSHFDQPLSNSGFQGLDSSLIFQPSDLSGKNAVDYHHSFFRFPSIQDNKIRIFEMAQLCRDHNVEFVLLLPPLHATYRKHREPWIINLNNNLIENLRSVKKVKVLDFTAHPAFGDNCFHDEFHLNARGALLFSKLIRQESHRKP
jgi:hypothetical protein